MLLTEQEDRESTGKTEKDIIQSKHKDLKANNGKQGWSTRQH